MIRPLVSRILEVVMPHRRNRPTVLAVLAALAVPAALAAQDLADLCKAVGNANVGQWAAFDATGGRSGGGGGGGGGKLRLAIVGSERVGDSTLYWFEVNFTGPDPSHSGIVQILTPGVGAGPGGTHAVIIKAGAQPATKISGQMAGMLGKQAGQDNSAFDWAARCMRAHVVGWESVTVPAGTFRALHVTTEDAGEVWASRDIPFGLVKVHDKRNDLVLTGHGADAKSSITEAPQEMSLPGLMTKP